MVKLELLVSASYKWIAQQPWGQWTAFTKKPRICTDRNVQPTPSKYWEANGGSEYDLTPEAESVSTPNWRNSLREI